MRTYIKNSKKIKYFSALVLCVLLGMILSACGGEKKPSENAVLDENLFGTWNQITEDGTPSLDDLGIPSGYVFGEDGNGTDLFWDVTFKYVTEDGIICIDYDDVTCDDASYTYVIQDDKITMTRVAEDALTMIYQKQVEETETE